MSELGKPTEVIRDYATDIADRLDHAMSLAEQACKELLGESCFGNGVRATTTKARRQCEEVMATILMLRKAIHDDFGTPSEVEPFIQQGE